MRSQYLLPLICLCFFACDRNDPDTPQPSDYGYLSMNISLSIASEPANGRVEAVSTENWRVIIFNADGSIALVFDPYSGAPPEIQLPTGEYYIEAHSNNFAEAAFENPCYFGRSENFTIDKEELKSIDVTAELANSKVKINYSDNVTSIFQDYLATVTVARTGAILIYKKEETREGYFISEPLEVFVNLLYTKLDGSFIQREFSTIIDARPKTLYNVNVDASLEDGKIMLNIDVNERVKVVNIPLGDERPDPNLNWIPGETWIDTRDGEEYGTVQIGEQVWMSENLRYLPQVDDEVSWTTASSFYEPGYSVFNYNGTSVEEAKQTPEYSTRGVIYNAWALLDYEGIDPTYAPGTQGACPSGWHVPSDIEWDILIDFLGGPDVAGGKLKEVGSENWRDPNVGATNEVGFNAIPGGRRYPDGRFVTPDIISQFRTSTPDPAVPIFQVVELLSYQNTTVVTMKIPPDFGICARCIKND